MILGFAQNKPTHFSLRAIIFSSFVMAPFFKGLLTWFSCDSIDVELAIYLFLDQEVKCKHDSTRQKLDLTISQFMQGVWSYILSVHDYSSRPPQNMIVDSCLCLALASSRHFTLCDDLCINTLGLAIQILSL